MMMWARRANPRRDETGAILPITVLVLATTLTLASLVIDIGGDRVVIRDMQSVADVVALDLARNIDGRAASGYPGFSASGPSASLLETQKNESLGRQAGLLTSPDQVTSRLAVANQETGEFLRYAAAADVPNAIRVWATGSSAFRLLPTTNEATELQRDALAVIGRPIVCIAAGATLADLTTNLGGPLDVFLGKLINVDRLSVLSPAGMAALNAQIPLGDLATELNLGTVDELAQASMSGRDLVAAAVEVLTADGQVAGASVLAVIEAQLLTPVLNLGDILNFNTGAGSAADLRISAFSLIQAVIQASNKNNFVNVNIPISVPGLTTTSLRMKVIEPPQIACGPVGTRARSAQIQVEFTSTVGTTLVTEAKVDPLYVTVADGWGTITDITCSLGGSTVTVAADTAAARLKLHMTTKSAALVGADLKLSIDVPDPATHPNGAAIANTTQASNTFSFPAGSTSLPAGWTAGTALGNLNLSSITPKVTVDSGLLSVLGLGTTLASVTSSLVVPLLGVTDPLLTAVLTPVLQSLGLRLGTVQIRPISFPACNEPALRD
jgi:uncharacterized membrane protein